MLIFDESLQQLCCLLLPELVAQLGWNMLDQMLLRLAHHFALPISRKTGALVKLRLVVDFEYVVVV